MNAKTTLFILIAVSLVGCSGARTLDGDPARWHSTLDSGDRITVFESSGDTTVIRYETIEAGVLYGVLYDEQGTSYSIPVDEIERLHIDGAADYSTGKTLAVVGLVVLGVALINALQDIPPGWPAYQ